MSFIEELKRRSVFRVGIAYVITAWLVAQVLELVFDSFGTPQWAMKTVLVVLAIGLPFALLLAWVFELTPEGLKRDSEVDQSPAMAAQKGRKLDRVIIIVLVASLGYFIWESRFAENETISASRDSALPSPGTEEVASASTEKSVAVLPFVNMSSDTEQEYFSDGITEEIINALVKIPRLSVPARTSVFAFKGRLQDVREIGRELNVAHVLEGSIRSQGQQVRITAQLINVNSGFHLWSETYDRQLDNIFAVQEEIALAIAGVLVGELGIGVQTVPNRTINMHAYDIYLQGRALLRDRDSGAVEALKQATEADPDFAPAWAALAIAYQVSGYFTGDKSTQDLALTTARYALSLDPENVDALTAMASALRDTWQWPEANEYFEAALAIDPQSSELLEDYAEFLCNVGRWDEYLAVSERGYHIDPLLVPLADAYVVALTMHGRHQEALDVLERFEDRKVVFGSAWNVQVLLAAGETVKAIQSLSALDTDEFPTEISSAMIKLLENPEDDQARETLRGLFLPDSRPEHTVVLENALIVLAFSGDADYLINSRLAQFGNAGWGNIEEIWQPAVTPVRQHPQFAEFLELVNLPEYWDQTGWPDICQREANGSIECK